MTKSQEYKTKKKYTTTIDPEGNSTKDKYKKEENRTRIQENNIQIIQEYKSTRAQDYNTKQYKSKRVKNTKIQLHKSARLQYSRVQIYKSASVHKYQKTQNEIVQQLMNSK